MVGGSKKIVENKFNSSWVWGDPRIFENPIFPAYVPEKNIIITPWLKCKFMLIGKKFLLTLIRVWFF